jgi:hypothetical protein
MEIERRLYASKVQNKLYNPSFYQSIKNKVCYFLHLSIKGLLKLHYGKGLNSIQVYGYDRAWVLDSSFRSKYHINAHTSLKGNTQALVKSQLATVGASPNPDLVAPTISLGECHKATIIDGRNTETEGVREDESKEKEENEKQRQAIVSNL